MSGAAGSVSPQRRGLWSQSVPKTCGAVDRAFVRVPWRVIGRWSAASCLSLTVALASPAAASQPTSDAETTVYLLGAVLEGPAKARLSARDELRPADGIPPPPLRLRGEVIPIATVTSLPSVWRWITAALFDGSPPRANTDAIIDPTAPAPVVGRVFKGGARVTAVSIHTLSNATSDLQAVPSNLGEVIDAKLTQAVLARPLSSQSFVSALPHARLPAPSPGSVLLRDNGLLVALGHVDRCILSPADLPASHGRATSPRSRRSCIRWLTVLAEEHGLIIAGFLPAFQVVTRASWECDRRGRCLQVSYIGSDGDDALFQVLAVDAEVRWASVRVPGLAGAVPQIKVTTAARGVKLTYEDGTSQRVRRGVFATAPPSVTVNIRAMLELDVVVDPKNK